MKKHLFLVGTICVISLIYGISSSSAQLPTSSESAGKTAVQAFKNIQVLKDIPADQLIPSMQFMSASLGVECEFCHAGRDFEKDDKKEKQTARQMITMMFAINKENFNGRRQVTCYSCHHGSNDVSGTPAILEEAEAEGGGDHGHQTPAGVGQTAAKPAPPSADDVINKYLQALGGAEALSKVNTRVEHGHINFGGRQATIDVFAKAPDKRLSVMHMPNGDSTTAFDGKTGWLGNSGRVREMNSAENLGAQIDAQLSFPQNLKQMFDEFRVGRPEKIANQDQTVVFGRKQGQPPVKMYFDPQSGLLTRVVRYTETPLGRLPVQVDLTNYREVGGVKVPEQWTLARPGGRFTIQIDQVDHQQPIADSKFAQPSEGSAGDGKSQ